MFIQVADGTTYHVKVQGQGEPLVCLHGFTGRATDWDFLCTAFELKYTIIAIDLLGHGQSEHPEDAARYSIEHTQEDIFFILQALNIQTCHVLGYSMGGRVALSFAIRYSECVTSLILESASPGLATAEERKQRQEVDLKLALNIEQSGLSWFAQYWSNIALFHTQRQLSSTVQQQLYTSRLQNSTIGLANSLRGIGTGCQPSYWDSLAEFSKPVTLVVGELDTKFVSIAQRMQSLFSKAEIVMVKQAGHNVHLEQEDAFIDVLAQAIKHI